METPNGTPGASTTPADSARRLKESATTVIDRTRQAAVGKAQEGVQQLGSTIHSATSALRRAADDVETDNSLLGAALRKSADSIDQATRSISDGDINRIVDDINGFARRQPAVFLGVTFALGFALARIGKAALEQTQNSGQTEEPITQMPGL
ncbi:MAG TPA: hypothetical protein VEA80_05290 [Vitreimonas sp.]|uniref:hypothetical protein n=1 Tax=Vitreimonas sp. TaxID=3069702 RepID=UPI002D6B0FFF|nr:hypothetical protein [Vitreimonas sp.]HYD86867.1 hypothetical protein [Vitreimonas sp.]